MAGQILGNINMLLEFLIFFYVIFCREYRKSKRKTRVGLLLCMGTWFGVIAMGVDLNRASIGMFPIPLIWVYLIIWSVFEVSIPELIAWGIGEWHIIALLESSLYTILELIFPSRYILGNASVLILSGFGVLFYFITRRSYHWKRHRLPLVLWYFLDGILLIMVTLIMLCDYLLITAFPHTKTLLLGRLLPAGGGIVVAALLFLILYFYRAFYDSRREEELTKLEKTRQREYFSKLLKREEETRRFRHDILNDLLELQNYCNHKNYEQMESYLERMLGTVEEISHSTYDVGNDIVNTVINYYFQPLRERCHIEVSGYMSEKSTIEERDLCVLSANLMKNAAEVAGKMKDGEIKVSIKEGKKYLCLQVKNSFEGEVYFDKKGLPITTKPDKRNHGIGTRNIAEVVEKNGGTYQAEAKDGMYAVEIYLKL